MIQTPPRKKSVGFLSGLVAGAVVATGAAFLYKTKSGKQTRKDLEKHSADIFNNLKVIVKDVKKKAKQLEKSLEESNQKVVKKTKKVRKKVTSQIEDQKKFFHRSGRRLSKTQ